MHYVWKECIQHSQILLQKDTTDKFFATLVYNYCTTIYLQLGKISLEKNTL